MKSKLLFSGRFLRVYGKESLYPNGYKAKVEYVKHPGSVAVLPFLSASQIIFIRQFRPVVGEYVWEIPAGTLEKGEKPLSCVRREIKEEIGFSARSFEKLGLIYLACGYSTEKMTVYKASCLRKLEHKPQGDKDELIEVKVLTLREVKRKARRGEILDSKTLVALFLSGII